MQLNSSKWLFIGILIQHTFVFHCSADENTHQPQQIKDDCTACHLAQPTALPQNSQYRLPDLSQFKKDGISLCTDCHSEKNAHVVGHQIDFDIPADLPLDNQNAMTCLTCHYTHGDLTSDEPQASISFMDMLLNSERLTKSFLIRRSNRDGELCLICHKVLEEN